MFPVNIFFFVYHRKDSTGVPTLNNVCCRLGTFGNIWNDGWLCEVSPKGNSLQTWSQGCRSLGELVNDTSSTLFFKALKNSHHSTDLLSLYTHRVFWAGGGS